MNDYKRRLQALHSRDRQPIRAEVPKVGGDETVATIRLYDPVDSWGEMWGVSAKEFTAALDDLPDTVNEIRLHINSPGGEVWEAIAVLNALRNHDARVVAIVDGIAASAASFIACGSDEVVMAKNSELMIHDAWGVCIGNAEDMRDLAEDLDRLSNNIASIYAEKAGGTADDWRAAMARETWYTAEEAVEAGLADRVDAKKSAAKDRFDLTIFAHAGRDNAPAPDDKPTVAITADTAQTVAAMAAVTDPAPSTEATEPAPAADATGPDTAADEDAEEHLALVARSLETLAQL